MDSQTSQRYTTLPFPSRIYKPGQGIHPRKDPNGLHIPEVPDSETPFGVDSWQDSQRYLYAIDLFNFGYWWEAHEVLEDLWIETGKTTELAQFIQAIIQISAAFLKVSLDSRRGGYRLMTKAFPKLDLQTGIFLGIEVEAFQAEVKNYILDKITSPPHIVLSGLNDE
ncbi:MAG: DUF309 domain-containing protein [Chloroflexota bacterium]